MTGRALRAVLATAFLLAAAACSSSGSAQPEEDGTPLIGTFRLSAGSCTSAGASGTYFRMINPGGTLESGKFFGNPDSRCPDKSFTLQTAGSDGGLVTGTFQPGTSTPFDAQGNGLASTIVQPSAFTAIQFAVSTNATDPQTGKKVAAPEIRVKDGKLSGQLTAWSAAWNKLYFNQGSPKPDGSRPGLTSPLTGTYDETTRKFELTWASQIVGGAFNGFTGYWHLQGTFVPKS